MNYKLSSTFGYLQKRLHGHYTMMTYGYSLLCTKADPMALLNIQVYDGAAERNLEDLAYVIVHDKDGDDDKFDLVPKNGPDDIPILSSAVMRSYPEFEQSVETIEENPEDENNIDEGEQEQINEIFGGDGDDDSFDIDVKPVFLRLTVPPVDDDRKKVLNDAVKVLYEATKIRMEADLKMASVEVAAYVVSASPEKAQKAETRLKAIRKEYEEYRDEAMANKKKEIEEANRRYHLQEVQKIDENSEVDGSWRKVQLK